MILALARENSIPTFERNFSLHDVYNADEAFLTGTFAGLTPVGSVDGRDIAKIPGPITEQLKSLYKSRIQKETAAGRIPWQP